MTENTIPKHCMRLFDGINNAKSKQKVITIQIPLKFPK